METQQKKIKQPVDHDPVAQKVHSMQQAITKRFVEFLDEKGPSKVARAIGVSPQKFYNFKSGTNPQIDTILQVSAAYPKEFDLVYVMTGRKLTATGEVITPVAETMPTEYIQNAISRIQKETEEKYMAQLAEKEKQLDVANRDKERMWSVIDALKKADPRSWLSPYLETLLKGSWSPLAES